MFVSLDSAEVPLACCGKNYTGKMSGKEVESCTRQRANVTGTASGSTVPGCAFKVHAFIDQHLLHFVGIPCALVIFQVV